MTHFRQAHQELRDIDTTVNKLGYHSANAIVQIERLRQEHDKATAPPSDNLSPTEEVPALPPAQANVVQPPVDPDLLLMQQMMQNMQTM